MNYHPPKEIPHVVLNAGITKAQMRISHILIMGVLAGAYVGFAAQGSSMAMHDISTLGIARFICGLIFPTALVLIVLSGAELFTGNVLLWVSLLERRISLKSLLRNWFWVYIGNFIGAVLFAWMMNKSGLWKYNDFLNGAFALKIALAKVDLTFSEAFIRGVMANWLVCLAVWITYAAKDTAGKILSMFFPIMLFATSAFEHSVANMYYLATGYFLRDNQAVIMAGSLVNLTGHLTISSIIIKNLIPVTLGNIIGGSVFVGSLYWLRYLKLERPSVAFKGQRKNDTRKLSAK